MKCRGPLAPYVGTGRPASYCSATCKRAAGYEITRVQRAIEHVEGLLRSYRMGFMRHLGENVAQMEAEREALEERLLELLDTPGPDVPPEDADE